MIGDGTMMSVSIVSIYCAYGLVLNRSIKMR